MGARPEQRISSLENRATRQAGPSSTKTMGTSESPNLSLVTTVQKAPAWRRTLFTLDTGFRGLMTLAGLAVLGIVGLIVAELAAAVSARPGINSDFISFWRVPGTRFPEVLGRSRLSLAPWFPRL